MIQITLNGKKIEVKAENELVLCKTCGKPVATVAQVDDMKQRFKFKKSIYNTCTDCKRKHYATSVAVEGHM